MATSAAQGCHPVAAPAQFVGQGEDEPVAAHADWVTEREPMIFIRLALMPGAIESVSARVTTEVITPEQANGNLRVTTLPKVLGRALVGICDGYLYTPLLGGDEPETESTLDLVALLLGSGDGNTASGGVIPQEVPAPHRRFVAADDSQSRGEADQTAANDDCGLPYDVSTDPAVGAVKS